MVVVIFASLYDDIIAQSARRQAGANARKVYSFTARIGLGWPLASGGLRGGGVVDGRRSSADGMPATQTIGGQLARRAPEVNRADSIRRVPPAGPAAGVTGLQRGAASRFAVGSARGASSERCRRRDGRRAAGPRASSSRKAVLVVVGDPGNHAAPRPHERGEAVNRVTPSVQAPPPERFAPELDKVRVALAVLNKPRRRRRASMLTSWATSGSTRGGGRAGGVAQQADTQPPIAKAAPEGGVSW